MFKLSNTFIALLLFISVIVIIVSSSFLFIDKYLMTSINEQEITFTITYGSSINSIADKLEENGVIKSATLFELAEMISSDSRPLRAGIYTFLPDQTYTQLLNTLKTGSNKDTETTMVTIPEGFTLDQIATRLEENDICTAKEFITLVKSKPQKDKAYLKNVENYEGFLFPDTYEFYYYSSPNTVLNKFLSQFENKMSGITDITNDTELYNKLKIASLIEKEAYHSDEMGKISGVINNRIKDDMLLQIDAALLYAIGHKEKIYEKDLQTDTPYNLYMYKGLPPPPICNPGINAIKAAYNPESSKYLYYVLDSETKYHRFGKTLEEHQANIKKYYKN